MDALARRGLVVRDRLRFDEIGDLPGAALMVRLHGRIECSDRIVVAVDKWLETQVGRRRELMVKGKWYSYHAWVRGKPRRDLLRYDNSHGDDSLHRHFFDEAGREIAVVPVSLDSLPRLDLLIRESVAVFRGTPIDELYQE